MQIKVYRGTHRIGGCVTEIKTTSARILVDMGEELPSVGTERTPLEIDGVTRGAPDCDAVLITHYHGDHIGMFGKILPEIPVYTGAVAKQIYGVVQTVLLDKHMGGDPQRVKTFREFRIGQPLQFGDIRVTPYTVDHSAFDAYMLLIEAEGKRILHTGDFRMHGARGRKMPAVFEKYCRNIDVLITEGTMLSRMDEPVVTEHALGRRALALLQDNPYVFTLCSSTNVDTVAAFYNAAARADRPFIVCADDLQTEILRIVTENATSPFYRFDRHKVYTYGKNLHAMMAERGFLFLGRANFATQKAIEAFPESLLVYAMWNGYLDKAHPAFDAYKSDFINHALRLGCRMEYLHTGGHASVDEILQVCKITDAKIVIPIHSERPEQLQALPVAGKVVVLQDNQSFTV